MTNDLCSQHHAFRRSPTARPIASPSGAIVDRTKIFPFTRRHFGLFLGSLAMSLSGWNAFAEPVPSEGNASASRYPLFKEALAGVIPERGFQSRISLGDSIPKLIRHGVIVPEKFAAIYEGHGRIPSNVTDALEKPSERAILLTGGNATTYVNLLWPVGLANHMTANADSPISGASLFSFASTGGWSLGKEKNGGAYFNKFPIIALTAEQEALAVDVAKTTFRPCCDNSTFYQDCNHGSALLGLLQLGVAQGLDANALYREALAFNSFWFPQVYVRTALYFKIVRNVDWADAEPREVMGFEYSAIRPWSKRVQARIETIPNLVPKENDDTRCGV